MQFRKNTKYHNVVGYILILFMNRFETNNIT